MNIVLGGGIAGISAAYHLQKNGYSYQLYEKNDSWGGLCDNFSINGFLFDYFSHFCYTSDRYVKNIFAESTPYFSHNPVFYNYYRGLWLQHPIHTHLALLSTDEKIKIIQDFVDKPSLSPSNYEEWLLVQFGEYFTTNFSSVYAQKYWTVPPKALVIDWIDQNFIKPELTDILHGAFEAQSENVSTSKEVRYPKEGGFKSFLAKLTEEINISLNKKAVLIDVQNKFVEFSDGTKDYYTTLISSIPLPELVKIIKDCPKEILSASSNLLPISGQLISLGFRHSDVPKCLCSHIYDEEIYPVRFNSPSMKSPFNAPEGKSSLQFETYFSKKAMPYLLGEKLLDHIITKGETMKLFSKSDIELADYREVEYANIIFDHKRQSVVNTIHSYLFKNEIVPIGRFGEWTYLFSDESLLSGKKALSKISNTVLQ